MIIWRGGKPPYSGYYLAVYQLHPTHPAIVSELWFNSAEEAGTWWAARGYLEGFGERSMFTSRRITTVSHWAMMPEPPTEV